MNKKEERFMELQHNETYRQKDKGWQVIVSYKVGKTWKQKSKQGFKSKKEAKLYSDKIIKELQSEISLSKDFKNITYKEFVGEYLNYKKGSISYNTYLFYKISLSKFKALNDIKLREITPVQVQKVVDKLKKESNIDITQYYRRLNALFLCAMNDYNIISSNPCKPIKDKKERTEKKALTIAEQEKLMTFLKTCTNPDVYIVSIIALKCGLRMGEILGLTWDKIDLREGQITVNIQWKKLSDGDYGFGALKTKNSYRVVPIPEKTIPLIKEFKETYPIRMDRRITKVNNIAEYCRRHYRYAGLEISIHQLRHTYATNLIANGLDFKTVAKLIGDDVKTVMAIYSHVTDDMLEKAKEIINSF